MEFIIVETGMGNPRSAETLISNKSESHNKSNTCRRVSEHFRKCTTLQNIT
jgi:hypothetical protein